MTLTNQQLVDVRYYLGYSVSGNATFSGARELVYSIVSYRGLSLDTRLANLQPEEEGRITNYFLANLYLREADIQTATSNLVVDKAGPFKRNAAEMTERRAAFRALRMELCVFLGFAPGPLLAATNSIARA